MTAPQRLVLIHTVPPLVEVFTRLAAECLPGVQVLHVLDEPLLERVRAQGGLDPDDVDRLAGHVAAAAKIDASAVLVTCSTVSPAVDAVRPVAPIPVFKIDEAMIAQAVRTGSRIGVIATNRTTLEPTRHLLEAEAARTGRPIAVELVMVDDALPALLAGDGATHDRLVLAALHHLAPSVDVVVLAQASIARVLAAAAPEGLSPDALPVPVLASPHLALDQVRTALSGSPSEPLRPSPRPARPLHQPESVVPDP